MSNADLVKDFQAGLSDKEIWTRTGLSQPEIAQRRLLLERGGWLKSSDPPLTNAQRARIAQDLDSHHRTMVQGSKLIFAAGRAAQISDEEMEQVRELLLAAWAIVGFDPYWLEGHSAEPSGRIEVSSG